MASRTVAQQLKMDLLIEGEEATKSDTTSTFSDNLSLPIHRWFRYSAGFSAPWARDLIEREKAKGKRTVLDPFAGSGTVPLEGETCNVAAIGIEAHPFVARITQAKLHWRENPRDFVRYALHILEAAKRREPEVTGYPALIQKCFPPKQ